MVKTNGSLSLVIELHATFLELNLLAQIRALPNPYYQQRSRTASSLAHPLTLHLTPTLSADVVVTSLDPAPGPSVPFVKIAPDAEVIVAPKSRSNSSRDHTNKSAIVTNTGNKSLRADSRTSAVSQKTHQANAYTRRALYFRGVDRRIGGEWFEDATDEASEGLKVWVDKYSLVSKGFKDVKWATISILRPSGLLQPLESQLQNPQSIEQSDTQATKPATRVIAQVLDWVDAPDGHHAALSAPLCVGLGIGEPVGAVIRFEMAPPPLIKKDIKSLKFYPFADTEIKRSNELRFRGDLKTKKGLANVAGPSKELLGNLKKEPLTDGLVLSDITAANPKMPPGGILGLEVNSGTQGHSEASAPNWFLGIDDKSNVEVQQTISPPSTFFRSLGPGDPIPPDLPSLVSINKILSNLMTHLSHNSSALLTGGLGSGKTHLAQLAAQRLRSKFLFHTSYFPCSTLIAEETRVPAIKETLERLFLSATWGARLGGCAIVILDDVDKLCPVETELQIGNDNGRSKQVTELLCSIVKQYCTMTSKVVLLATAQGKDALNNLIIRMHVVREVIELKAPDKEGRKDILMMLATRGTAGEEATSVKLGDKQSESLPRQSKAERPGHSGFIIDKSLDFFHLAGQTDGYMPGDLVLLLSRARSEALLRYIESSPSQSDGFPLVPLGKEDFTAALKGFTPASLRNVPLHSAGTTFASIGGLHPVRKTLLETLQYPTKYASIFAKCPLRLRSGLLLYGYPGCGKTLLASAVAGECGLNFISVKGPEILNKYIGASEKSVRDLFERAQAARPAVLFFDEFDSIAPKRGHDSTGVTDRVVNQLLTQMDGAEGLSGVYVLAATSRPDLIDPALLRPGRLDKSLLCGLPAYEDRVDILRTLSKKLKMSEEVRDRGFEEVARETEGYSGADLQALVYNAQLEAIHEVLGEDKVSHFSGKAQRKHNSDESSIPEFITFRIGEAEDLEERADRAKSQWGAGKAKIVAKLKEIQEHQRHHQGDDEDDDQQPLKTSADKDSSVVMIKYYHLMASLSTTRPSIGLQERRRLEGIYHEFVVGRRSGEMFTGEALGEIGGRISLM